MIESLFNKKVKTILLYATFITLIVFIYVAKAPLNCVDFFYCLQTGNSLVEKGIISETIDYVFTEYGKPTTDHRWLAHLIFYLIYNFLGPQGAILLNSIVITTAFIILFFTCLFLSKEPRIATVCTLLGFFLSAQNLNIRTQMFSTLCFSLLILLLVLFAEKTLEKNTSWLNKKQVIAGLIGFSVIFIFWTNTHSAFFLGIIVVGIFWLDSIYEWYLHRNSNQLKKRVLFFTLVLITAVLSLLVNPYGIGILKEITENTSKSLGRGVDEWLPTPMNSTTGKTLLLSVFLLLMLFKFTKVNLRLMEIIFILGFMSMAFISFRTAIWWGFVGAVLIARHSNEKSIINFFSEVNEFKTFILPVFISFLLIIAIFSNPYTKHLNPLIQGEEKLINTSETPIKLVDFLLTRNIKPTDRIFNSLPWGGYLYWRLKIPLFIDERINIYSNTTWNDYATITNVNEGWEQALQKWNINYVIAANSYDKKLISELNKNKNWKFLYKDTTGVVFQKVGT